MQYFYSLDKLVTSKQSHIYKKKAWVESICNVEIT